MTRARARGIPSVFAAVAMGVLAGAVTMANDAHAETPPSVWECAKNPSLRGTWSLHVLVRELMTAPVDEAMENAHNAALQSARVKLEEAAAEKGPDVRLRFDLGEIYELLDMHERAVAVLRPALAEAPSHAGAKDAWSAIGTAYAKLGWQRDERDAYLEFLAREPDDHLRMTALGNLAEAEMHLGNLDEAVARYRETLRVAGAVPGGSAHLTSVLAVWGLAVALDRAGDPSGAMENARLATTWDVGEQIIGHHPAVFFVPAYERTFYLGLAAMVHAREARDPRLAAMYWERAEVQWTIYVGSADASDRWVRLARAHRDVCHAERVAAARRPAPSGLPVSPAANVSPVPY